MAFEFFKKLISKFTKPKKTPLLGLALGSGGARGMAHIGILRAFEEEGISFNVVSGSSIGSIVGGLYCAGFSSRAMNEYLKELDILNPQKLLALKIAGVSTQTILDRAMGGADIQDLKLPYCAVAVDLYSGEEVQITSGNVATAMCASSAIPPIFKPVEYMGQKLVDGAYLNNVPADACKKMGASVVIGVNLSKENPTNAQIKSVADNMYKGHKIPYANRAEKGEKYSDFMLYPNLEQYTAASITKIDEIQEIGYECAKRAMPEIKKLLKAKKIIKG